MFCYDVISNIPKTHYAWFDILFADNNVFSLLFF